jgi:hypothetical protein
MVGVYGLRRPLADCAPRGSLLVASEDQLKRKELPPGRYARRQFLRSGRVLAPVVRHISSSYKSLSLIVMSRLSGSVNHTSRHVS